MPGKVPPQNHSAIKFFLVAPPEVTTELVTGDKRDRAVMYYKKALNEDSIEIWLHRGFERMTASRVNDPAEADVIVVAGYFHLNLALKKNKQALPLYYEKHLKSNDTKTKSKPHLFLIPSTNPQVAGKIGNKDLIKAAQNWGISNIWSVGFERNPRWQGVPSSRTIPIPYVLRPSASFHELQEKSKHEKLPNSVFYSGDSRKLAISWGGCDRQAMIDPLQRDAIAHNITNQIDVRIVGKGLKTKRLTQEEYNSRMLISEYCLILCGDTPTSRSLTSSMVAGCIPIRVGSRLRGLCEPPCRKGWGWTIPGIDNPHLPYSSTIPWEKFPEVPEQELIDKGIQALENHIFEVYHKKEKDDLRRIMKDSMGAWIYGWGDPVSSEDFGDAVSNIWQSFTNVIESVGSNEKTSD